MIFGVCQGFETLTYLASGDDKDVLQTVDVVNKQKSVKWNVQNVNQESKIFANFRSDVINKMAKEEVTFQFHMYGNKLETYMNHERLRTFFKLIATDTYTDDNQEYITIVEANNYPIFGVMFHPEY